MRIPRSVQLYNESAVTHMVWRCHNKEFYLRPLNIKSLYMQSICESIKKNSLNDKVLIHAFCIMDNHFHQATGYKESSSHLSKHMQYAHSLFGARYNRINKRTGKVAESRPKTFLIENVEHEMKVHFYIEANPIRARICTPENLKDYKYSSYRFYAYGIRDNYTNLLTIPQWYVELGRTAKERQKKYRKLFYEYLFEQEQLTFKSCQFEQAFIGSTIWKLKQKRRVTNFKQNKIENSC